MNSTPCSVCGGTDLNLVDGFYYCVECGTQDTNVRETIVEQTVLADGTFAHATTKRFTTFLKDGIEMSSEWYKWHAFNFILNGLTEELLSLGAAPSVKLKVLWIWIRYIKKFQVKEDFNKTSQTHKDYSKSSKDVCEDVSKDIYDQDEDNENHSHSDETKKAENFRRDIKIVTKGTLLTILYVALNLDRSDIQLSDLFRYINEGRLSIYNCIKFVPKELNIKSIPHWKNFILCQNRYTPKAIRALAMTLFKRLDLGVPIVPNLTRLFDIYIKELCLPLDFRNFVFSLVHLIPCDFLQIGPRSRKYIIRLPDYEGVCMSYILMALKICFGLDCDYELKLSDEIDKINNEENYLKSYKLGYVSEPTDRLFSFREWYKFLQFRKTIVCKHYLPMARRYNLSVEDNVLMEHLEERNKRRIKLSDDVTMDILKKIPQDDYSYVIPKREFISTFTPLTTYTEVILKHIQDPDLRLLLCEDFTQYSLKYACRDLRLPESTDSGEIIVGVNDTNKTINPYVLGNLASGNKGDRTLVFVRNCDNENWLETKPPTIHHITKTDSGSPNDKDSDHGYDSNSENNECSEVDDKISEESKLELDTAEHIDKFIEEVENVSIFDDDFKDLNLEDGEADTTKIESEISYNDVTKYEDEMQHFPFDDNNINDDNSVSSSYIDPDKVDRTGLIQELIEIACKKYKIPKPRESRVREPRKRKSNFINDEAGQSTATKRKRVSTPGETKNNVGQIISSYFENLNNDILNQISEHVKSIVHNVGGIDDKQPNISASLHSTHLNDTELQNASSVINDNTSNVLPSVNSIGSDTIVEGNVLPLQDVNSIGPDTTVEDTILDENVDHLLRKTNPDFDKETHDIKQLYIKLDEECSFEKSLCINDTDLDKIIDKKIEEFAKCDKLPEIVQVQDDTSDSEDDLPLKSLQEEKEIVKQKRHSPEKFASLITSSHIKRFNIWIRHYKSRCVTRSLDMSEKFDYELSENCPPSFVFVIRECASILDCTSFCLYKNLQTLEEKLLCFKD